MKKILKLEGYGPRGRDNYIKMTKIISKKLAKTFYKKSIIFNYYFFKIFKKNIRLKLNEILKYDESDINLRQNDQEEQALPGMKKYKKNGWYKYMFARYLFAIKYIKNKNILDTACGLGWGSYLISEYPNKIVAIDIDNKSLDFAKNHWESKNLFFANNSILEINKLKQYFDVVLGYEVIEHLPFDSGKNYIYEISNSLNKRGILILSSAFPETRKKAKVLENKNKYHPHIYTKDEMVNLLKKNGFKKIKFYGNFMVKAIKNEKCKNIYTKFV